MPRALSDVWRHFTPANVLGKSVYMCKYCDKTYMKNATKRQQHIAKWQKNPQGPKHAADRISTPGGNESVSAVSESDTLWSAPGSPGTRGFFDFMDEPSQRNADECFARAVYATGSPLMLPSNVYWKRFLNVLRPACTPPTRHALSTHLLDEEFKQRSSRPLTKLTVFQSSLMDGQISRAKELLTTSSPLLNLFSRV